MIFLDKVHSGYVHTRRVRILCDRLIRLIPPGARVLDVGCGDGLLTQQIAVNRVDVTISGVEVNGRQDTKIPVEHFDGRKLPYQDKQFDVVLFVDVLHHTVDPIGLLREATRVARHSVIIKDHLRDGFLAATTLRFMDRLSNAKHGVALPYNYLSRAEWRKAFNDLRLKPAEWETNLDLYPAPFSWVFGRNLHFIAQLHASYGD